MKPAAFSYHRAHDLEEAVDLLAELGEDAKVLAGGQSLVPMMNFRLARPAALVDITAVPDLSYLRAGTSLSVGALTRHRQVEVCRDPEVLAGWPVLPLATRWIGHYPIRVRGTVGGSVAHADPTAELAMVALALDAEIRVVGPDGPRSIPAGQFFRGFLTTALAAGEIVVEVVFGLAGRQAALTEFARRRGDFAIVAAAVSVEVTAGVCRDARVVLGGVDVIPVRVAPAESILDGAAVDREVWAAAADAAAGAIEPGSDVHGSADYRRRLARTLVLRALEEALASAT